MLMSVVGQVLCKLPQLPFLIKLNLCCIADMFDSFQSRLANSDLCSHVSLPESKGYLKSLSSGQQQEPRKARVRVKKGKRKLVGNLRKEKMDCWVFSPCPSPTPAEDGRLIL